MSVTSKLPRGPQPDRVRPGEKVMRSGGADLQNGWLARHGTLSLTEERLVFVPTPLDRLMRARRHEILFSRLTEVERQPADPAGGNPGGRRARMVVRDDVCAYEFMVSDLDSWIDTIEVTVDRARRAGRAGAGEQLRVIRTNYVNPFLDDAG